MEWWKQPEFANIFGPSGQPKEAPAVPAQPVPAQEGYTGNGADGVMQPAMRAPGAGNGSYDAHEGEFVLNANATQHIGSDVLDKMQKNAESGNLDLNKIRTAVGLDTKQGYQTGGATMPVQPNGGLKRAERAAPAPQRQAGRITPVPDPDIKGPDPINIDMPTIVPDIKGPEGIDMPDIKPGPSYADDPNAWQRKDGVRPLPQPDGVLRPDPDSVQEYGAKKEAIGLDDVKPIDPDGKEAIKIDDPKPLDPDEGPSEQDIKDYLNGVMDGSNPYFQTIKDLFAQDVSGAGAATTAALKQQAAMAGMDEAQIAAMGMGRARDIDDSVSRGIGELLKQQQEMGLQAAKDIWSMEKDEWNMEMQQKQLDWAKEKYGDQKGGLIADLVNKGWSLEQIQKQFPDLDITQADYDSMKEMSPQQFSKDKFDYQKKVDGFNQLLAQGGAENLGKAGALFNDMFGTDIDFDNALTEENLDNWNMTYNDMTSSIASGQSFEDWMATAKANGTYDNLNMTETDIKSMYESMQLQSNPLWIASEGYKQLVEQGILSEEGYEDLMAIAEYEITHPGGITVSDSYQVLDKNGGQVKNFQTEEEAQAYIDDHSEEEYTSNVLENGWVGLTDPDAGPGPDPDVVPGGTSNDPIRPYTTKEWEELPVADKNDAFFETIPAGEMENWEGEDGYDKWVEAGMPQTFDAYNEDLGEHDPFVQDMQDKYKDGWPDYPDIGPYSGGFIEKGREDFMNGESNVRSYVPDEVSWLRASKDWTRGDVIVVEGHQNPFVVFRDAGDEEGMYLLDMITGKQIKIGKENFDDWMSQ